MRTVMYGRHSISEEIQKNSIEMQKRAAKEAAKQYNLFLDEKDFYLDEKVSARRNKINGRPALKKLLAEVERGEIQNVIVFRRCRLARNVGEHLEIYEMFKQHGIRIIFSAVGEPPMLYSEEGELLESILAARNEEEGNKIVANIRAGKMAKFKEGKNPQGQYPYGYTGKDGVYELVDKELKSVVKIFNMFLEYNFDNFERFVDFLKVKKIIDANWKSSRVRSIILNPIYKGVRTFKGETMSMPELAVISEYKWADAQDKYETHYKSGRKNKKHIVNFLFKEKMWCQECNKEINVRKYRSEGKASGFYECLEHDVKLKKSEIEPFLLTEAIEFVSSLFLPRWHHEFNNHMRAAKQQIEKEISNVQRSMKNTFKQIEELMAHFMTAKNPSVKLSLIKKYDEYKKLEKKLGDRKFRIRQYEELLKFSEVLKTRGMQELQFMLDDKGRSNEDLLSEVIHRVYVRKGEISIVWDYPHADAREVSTVEYL